MCVLFHFFFRFRIEILQIIWASSSHSHHIRLWCDLSWVQVRETNLFVNLTNVLCVMSLICFHFLPFQPYQRNKWRANVRCYQNNVCTDWNMWWKRNRKPLNSIWPNITHSTCCMANLILCLVVFSIWFTETAANEWFHEIREKKRRSGKRIYNEMKIGCACSTCKAQVIIALISLHMYPLYR